MTPSRFIALAPISLLLFLPFVLFGSVTFGGYTLLPVDNLFQWEPFRTSAVTFGISQPHNELLSDLILENYVWKRFILDSLSQGELPLWNPYIFAGVPFWAAGQHSALYPISLVYYLLPLPVAYGWYTAINLGIAGICMYIFMRTLGLGRSASTFAGIAYQFSGWMVVSVVFQMVIASAAWLPLILAMCERVIMQTPAMRRYPSSAPWVVIGAIALCLNILAGHVEITVYTLLVTVLYCLWRLLTVFDLSLGGRERKTALTRAGWLLAMGLLGAALGLIQLVPLMELVSSSFRSARTDFAQVLSYGFPLRYFTQWLMPHFYGNPSHHSYFDWFTWQIQPVNTARGDTAWGIKDYVEGAAYVGMVTLWLAGLALWAKWRDRRWKLLSELPIGFLGVLSLASVLFIFGTYAYAILYYGLPGINQLHSPFRWKFPLTICLIALAAMGFEWLIQHRQDVFNKVRARAIRLTALASLIFGVLIVLGVIIARFTIPAIVPLITPLAQTADKANPGMADMALFFSYQAANFLRLGFLLIASGVVLWLAMKPSVKKAPFTVGMLSLITIDLISAWWGFNPAIDPKLLAHVPDAIQFLQKDKTLWRLTTYEASGQKPLNANAAWHFNLQDIRGYDSIIPRQYVNFMQLVQPQGELPYNRIAPIQNPSALQSPLLDLLGVKYVLTVDEINAPSYKQVYNDGRTRIYQNERALPRAFSLPMTSGVLTDNFGFAVTKYDPRQYLIVDTTCGITDIGCTLPQPAQPQPATVTVYKNNEVWVDVDVLDPTWLLLADSYAPGWRAYARPHGGKDTDERELPIALANGNFRAVLLDNSNLKSGSQRTTASPAPELTAPNTRFNSQPQDTPSPTRYTIRFRYSPISVRIGAIGSLVALILVGALGAIYIWRTMGIGRGGSGGSQVRQVARNSLVLTSFNIISRIIDMAFATVVLRALGPEGNGNYTFAVVLVTWFEILMNFGLNTFLIRDVARDKQHAARYFYSTSRLRLMLGLAAAPLVALVILLYVWLDNMHPETTLTLILLVVSQLPGSLATGLSALFFAHEKAEIPSFLTIISALIKVILGTIVLLVLGWGMVGLGVVSIFTNLVTLVALSIAAVRVLNLKLTPTQLRDKANDEHSPREIVREAWPLMVNHLLSTIYWRIDVPLIKAFTRDAAQVGYYGAGYKYVDAFNIIPSLFTQALFPAMARMAANSAAGHSAAGHSAISHDQPLARAYVLAVKLLFMLALPLSVLVSFAASLLIEIIGGSAYLPQGALGLAIVIWHMPIGWINSVTNYALIAAGQQRKLTRAFIGAVAFNIIANIIFIPRYGFVAAAVVTALSEIAQLITFYFYVRQHISQVNWVQVISKPLLGAGLMALIIFVFQWLNMLWLGALLGLGVYMLVLVGLRVLTHGEQHTLKPLLPARLRGGV